MARKGRKRLMNSDIISNLPEGIITNQILAKLPIRDAVRTSVLSRNWRKKWTALPKLVFKGTDSAFYTNPASREVDEEKLVKVIYRVFCQHEGPIHSFCLAIISKMSTSYPDVDQWINFLSRNGIMYLMIMLFENENRYKIHSSLFSCAKLITLNLRCCIIPSIPPTFGGFSDLTHLKLESVSFNNEGFENLVSKCLKIINLCLDFVDGVNTLNIDYAPKLESLEFRGISLKSIHLKNTPCLLQTFMSFLELPDMHEIDEGSVSSIYNLNGLSNLRAFTAGLYFLKFLAQAAVRNLLPPIFRNLNCVEFQEMMFDDIDSLSSALGLVTNSPDLVHVRIITVADDVTDLATEQKLRTATEYLVGGSLSISCLMKLKYVEMVDVYGIEPEMELIKLILGKSPSLEVMKVSLNGAISDSIEEEAKISKKLHRFPRASKTAEIIFQDNDRTVSNILKKSYSSYWK